MKIRALIGFAALAVAALNAQQEGTAKPPAKSEATKPASISSPYRFEYTLTELSGKQKINTRKFEILTSDRGSVRADSRAVIPTGGGAPGIQAQFNYVDVGLDANMHYLPAGDAIHLDVQVSMTFVVAPEGTSSAPPGTRTIKMEISTEVKPGVPTSIGTVEDVASTHAYELSVTATQR